METNKKGAQPTPEIDNQVNAVASEAKVEDAKREGTLSTLTPSTLPMTKGTYVVAEGATQESLLVETMDSPILLEQGKDEYTRAKFLVTTIGQKNKNGRVYPESVVAKELSLGMKGDILGQDSHPTDTPKFTEQFLIWEKFMVESGREFAVAKVVPTVPQGTNFLLLARAGAMASCSRRGIGSVKEGTVGGQKAQIVQDDYRLVAIDILPPNVQSDHNAYLMRLESVQSEIQQINEVLPQAIQEKENTEGNEKTNMPAEPENVTAVQDAPAVATTDAPVQEQVQTAPVTVPAQSQTPAAVEPTTQPASVQAVPTAEKASSVTATEQQNAPALTEIIENLTSELQARDAQITNQNVKLSELAGSKVTQEKQIEAMTETFTALNAEIFRLDKAISELNGAVQDRNKIISERDELLIKRNKTLAERQSLLVKAHETISQRDVAMADRNQMVMQRNSLVSLRDQEISKRDKELAARNETIAKQDRVIAERDEAVAARDQTIALERASLAERDAMISQIDFGLVEKNREIMELSNQVLAEKVNVEQEKERNKAFQYLFEKVQIEGEKASWFIFNDLKSCATVQEVDDKFDASKEKGIVLIEGVTRTAGKAILKDTAPTDADELTQDKSKSKTKTDDKNHTAQDSEFDRNAKMVARSGGF